MIHQKPDNGKTRCHGCGDEILAAEATWDDGDAYCMDCDDWVPETEEEGMC